MHSFSLLKSRTAAVVTGAVVVVGLGASSGYAATLITSAQIADNTIQARDIHAGGVGSEEVADGTLRPRDLGTALTDQIAQAGQPGATGAKGEPGATGATGAAGDSAYDIWLADGNAGTPSDFLDSLKGATGATGPAGADATYVGENWGVVDRNVIGGGLAELRPGPTAMGASGLIEPPLGIGSLGIHTGSTTDKAAFGNQVDFAGQSFSDITKLGYSVFTTGENNGMSPNNMPSITFEIDPNLSTSTRNYSSLVFAPNNSTANAWTAIDATDDAQGAVWGLTGSGMPCSLDGARCTWSEIQAALNDGGDPATILTVQITKGRDYAFSGAVDALTINDQVFDFEPTGVK